MQTQKNMLSLISKQETGSGRCMTLVETLIQDASNYGIGVYTMYLDGIPALYIKINGDPLIIVSPTDTQAQLACLLVEELGHYHTGSDLRLTYRKLDDLKAEHRARRWGHHRLLPPDKIMDALRQNLADEYELAEYLGVTVEFLREAVEDYRCEGILPLLAKSF